MTAGQLAGVAICGDGDSGYVDHGEAVVKHGERGVGALMGGMGREQGLEVDLSKGDLGRGQVGDRVVDRLDMVDHLVWTDGVAVLGADEDLENRVIEKSDGKQCCVLNQGHVVLGLAGD